MKTAIAKYAMSGLALIGALLCGNARAQIYVQDGSLNTAAATANSTSVSVPSFTVTAGAKVLVVSLYDRNQSLTAPTNGSSPSSLSWGTQTITRVVSQNNLTSHYADSDIYYLWDPTPGTFTITATDTTGQTPSAMTMQAFTLGGVDTNVAPVTYGIGNADIDSIGFITLTLANNTPGGAWAVISGSAGDNGSGYYITSSGGTTNYDYIVNNQSQIMGAIEVLPGGPTTITNGDTTANSTQVGLAVAVFASAVGGIESAPTNVVAIGQTNQIALSWQDSTGGNATNYIILRSTTSGSGYTPIATNSGNASVTYTDRNVVPYTTYYYVVQAKGSYGSGPYSSQVSAFAVGIDPAPTGLEASPLNNQVGLVWSPPPGATSYNVLRATASGGPYTVIASPTSAVYTDNTVTDGQTYYYEVNAVNGFGTSANSAYVSATPAVVPFGISLHDGSLNSVLTASGSSTISMNFPVTQGASVMVVKLWDYNHQLDNSSPSFMTWSNAALGTTQTLTRVVSENCDGYNYSDSDIFYLWNPNPGWGFVSGTDTNSAAPGAMTMQVYTLNGVNTSIAPATYAAQGPLSTSLSINTSPTTASGSWAEVISYNANTGNGLTNEATSGTSYYYENNTVNAMGYISNLLAGVTTITAQENSGGAPTLMDIAVAVFTPVIGTLAPQNLQATGQTNQIALSWQSVGGATSYIVSRATANGGPYTAIATNNGNASVTYTDTSVADWTTYYYVVQAVGSLGTSFYSTHASANAVGLPTAATGFTAADGINSVLLTWNAAPSSPTAYIILRSTTSGSGFTQIASTSGTATGYTDTGVTDGTLYYYEIEVSNSFGSVPIQPKSAPFPR